jgi:hypothetical protein
MPNNPTTYLYTYLPTYAPTFLPIHYAYLPIYVFYIVKFLINYLLVFSNPTPSNPTYSFIKVRPSSWMMNTSPHMYVLQTIYSGNNAIIITILV